MDAAKPYQVLAMRSQLSVGVDAFGATISADPIPDSRGMGCGMPGARSSCQCMWVFTMPGITYLPMPSIAASAAGPLSAGSAGRPR